MILWLTLFTGQSQAAIPIAKLTEVPKVRIAEISASEVPDHFYFFNHIHSRHSGDNKDRTKEKLEALEIYSQALSFLKRQNIKGAIAITDHNNIRAHKDLENSMDLDPRLTSIRSLEWGARSHVGLLGVDADWVRDDHQRRLPEFAGLIRMAKRQAQLVVVNHPRMIYGQWNPKEWSEADAVEIWNQPYDHIPMQEKNPFSVFTSNQAAYQDWQRSLARGYRYTALAGSDFHFRLSCSLEHMLLFPTNLVLGDANDQTSALTSIKQGRVSLVLTPYAPKVFSSAHWEHSKEKAEMGGQLVGRGELNFQVKLDFSASEQSLQPDCYQERLSKGLRALGKGARYLVSLKNAQGRLRQIEVEVTYAKTLQVDWKLLVKNLDPMSLFVEVALVNAHGGQRTIQAISNPIYLNSSRH